MAILILALALVIEAIFAAGIASVRMAIGLGNMPFFGAWFCIFWRRQTQTDNAAL